MPANLPLARIWAAWTLKRRIAGGLRALERNPARTLRDHLEDHARRRSDRPALIEGSRTLSYRQLNAAANRYARWARSLSLARGQVVGVLLQDGIETICCWMGLAKQGVVACLLDPASRPAQIALTLERAAAGVLLVHGDLLNLAPLRTEAEASGLRIFLHGESSGAGSSALPRLDLMLRGFSDADVPAKERRVLRLGDSCLALGDRPDVPLDHRSMLRLIVETSVRLGLNERDCIAVAASAHNHVAIGGIGAAIWGGATALLTGPATEDGLWGLLASRRATCLVADVSHVALMIREALPEHPPRSLRIAMLDGLPSGIAAQWLRRCPRLQLRSIPDDAVACTKTVRPQSRNDAGEPVATVGHEPGASRRPPAVDRG